jgi:hypothetical protein
VCGEEMTNDHLLEHIRLYHPDDYEPLLEWPDGTPVIIDNTLEPDDFEEGTLP